MYCLFRSPRDRKREEGTSSRKDSDQSNGEPEELDEETLAMQQVMGFSHFDTTKVCDIHCLACMIDSAGKVFVKPAANMAARFHCLYVCTEVCSAYLSLLAVSSLFACELGQ